MAFKRLKKIPSRYNELKERGGKFKRRLFVVPSRETYPGAFTDERPTRLGRTVTHAKKLGRTPEHLRRGRQRHGELMRQGLKDISHEISTPVLGRVYYGSQRALARGTRVYRNARTKWDSPEARERRRESREYYRGPGIEAVKQFRDIGLKKNYTYKMRKITGYKTKYVNGRRKRVRVVYKVPYRVHTRKPSSKKNYHGKRHYNKPYRKKRRNTYIDYSDPFNW